MITLGPLALPVGLIVLLGAYWIGVWVAAAAPDEQPEIPRRALFRSFVVGLLAARAAFVLSYLPEYLAAPLAILDISDQGFLMWPGLLAAVAVMALYAWRRSAHRRVMIVSSVAAALVFIGGQLGAQYWLRHNYPVMQPFALTTLSGKPYTLQASGRPMIINLWATWCPHCRREMPALTAAQRGHPQVDFIFADQAEDATTVGRYLKGLGIAPANVLLDAESSLSRYFGTRSLPVTIFVDADGRVVDMHFGAISRAGIARGLESAASR